MENQVTLKVDDKKQKKGKRFNCFFCKQPVIFYGDYKINEDGQRKAVMFNEDGTDHVHTNEQKSENKHAKSSKFYRWWFGFGQYRFKHGYKKEYNRYRAEDYNNTWKENQKKRDEYKQKYENKNLSIEQALNVLEITGEDLKSCIAKFFDKFVSDKALIKIVKDAYKKLALKFHPDRQPQTATDAEKEATTQKFKDATEAFEKLESKFKYIQ
jgi:hypothetical protein